MAEQEAGYIRYWSSRFKPDSFGNVVFPRELEGRLRTPKHLQRPLEGKGAAKIGQYCDPQRLKETSITWIDDKLERVGINNVGDLLEVPDSLVDHLAKNGEARGLREGAIRFLGEVIIDTREDKLIRAVYRDRVEPKSQLVPNCISEGSESARTVMVFTVLQDFGSHNGEHQRMKQILELRFGFGGRTETLERVGRELGVSAERARQLQHKGLSILRHRHHSKFLRQFVPYQQGSIARARLRASCGFELKDLIDLTSEVFDQSAKTLPLSKAASEEFSRRAVLYGKVRMPLWMLMDKFLDSSAEELSNETTKEVLEAVHRLRE